MIGRLVLLPGMDGTGELFTGFLKALPLGLESIIIRFPGDISMSGSELALFLKSRIPTTEPFVLLAESFSTPLAIQFAATNPPNLRGLILSTGFAKSPVPNWLGACLPFFAPVLFRIRMPQSLAERFLLNTRISHNVLHDLRTAVASVRLAVLTSRLRFILDCDARNELEQITIPILYVQATEDRLVSNHSGEEIKRINPNVTVIALNGSHLLLQCMPHQSAEVVSDFIQRID